MEKSYLSDLFGWTIHRQAAQANPPGALLETIEPNFERMYSVLGVPMLFQTNDAALLDMATESFGRYPAMASDHQIPMVVRLFAHDVPWADKLFQDGHRPRPIYRSQGHLFYTSAGEASTAVMDLQRGFATGFINRRFLVDPLFVCFTFIESIAFILLSTFGRSLPLHAACVTRNRRSVIFKGDSNSGKSTLTMACVRHGYQIVSEDTLFVRGPAQGLELWGNPWRLHLLPDTKTFFPEISQEEPRLQINGEWKLSIDMEALYPGSTSATAPLGALVFLSRGGESRKTTLNILSVEEVKDKLVITWPFMVGWTDEMEIIKQRLVNQPAYQLVTNGTPDQSVEFINEILSREGLTG